jgi:hypothetical protein
VHLINLEQYRRKEVVDALKALLAAAETGDIQGIVYVAKVGPGDHRAGTVGVYRRHRAVRKFKVVPHPCGSRVVPERTMKSTMILLALLAGTAAAQTYVAPHVRKDGTYVDGHYRSAPNRTVDDNYGTRGNYNPYTGSTGTQPRSYEQPNPYQYQAPRQQQCGYTSTGRYVCQ